jgi:hypothetical protein
MHPPTNRRLGHLLPPTHPPDRSPVIPQASAERVHSHRAEIAAADVEQREGFAVTTPMRTLLDVADGRSVTDEQLTRAVEDALRRRRVRRTKLEAAAGTSPGGERLLRHLQTVEA